jgi:hypothetical protein
MLYRLGLPIYEMWGDLRMRFVDDIRKCVVFLAPFEGDGVPSYVGTGFFVECEDWHYLVTARHMAECLENGPIVIGVNNRDG